MGIFLNIFAQNFIIIGSWFNGIDGCIWMAIGKKNGRHANICACVNNHPRLFHKPNIAIFFLFDDSTKNALIEHVASQI